ncbi:MAG: hypothetical protein LBN37_03880, partial [Bacteroidales bacterium]|nr:hypothetical protein [Bacteroidales bacterium]
MKRRVFIPAFAAILLAFGGCNKDKDNEVVDPVVASISSKWEISDPASKYAAFEFQTDGTYIVTEYVTVSTKALKTSASIADGKLSQNPFFTVGKDAKQIVRTGETKQ